MCERYKVGEGVRFLTEGGGGWLVIASPGVLTSHNRSSSDQQNDVNWSVTIVFVRFVYNLQHTKWTGNK